MVIEYDFYYSNYLKILSFLFCFVVLFLFVLRRMCSWLLLSTVFYKISFMKLIDVFPMSIYLLIFGLLLEFFICNCLFLFAILSILPHIFCSFMLGAYTFGMSFWHTDILYCYCIMPLALIVFLILKTTYYDTDKLLFLKRCPLRFFLEVRYNWRFN